MCGGGGGGGGGGNYHFFFIRRIGPLPPKKSGISSTQKNI